MKPSLNQVFFLPRENNKNCLFCSEDTVLPQPKLTWVVMPPTGLDNTVTR